MTYRIRTTYGRFIARDDYGLHTTRKSKALSFEDKEAARLIVRECLAQHPKIGPLTITSQ